MITDLSQPVFTPPEADASIVVLRYEPWEARQGDSMSIYRRIARWFSFLSTLILAVLAFSPERFNVPLNMRPWIFLAFIFWSFAYCAGIFNS